MQLDDKLVEDRDAAHAESQQREDLLEHGEDTLPEPVTEAIHDATRERRGQLLGAIRMILDRQNLEIGRLHMPAREARALEALQAAVSGKSTHLNQFVYASDRRDLLERALGVLQPNLTRADDQTAHELHAQLADLSERVGELRARLTDLEDAQDELLEAHQKAELEATPGEPKPKPKPVPSDPDAPRPATTLTGPELPAQAPPATTLIGPELPAQAPPATTLAGPELPAQAPPATTLAGPELPAQAPPATTLAGPELPEEPAPPSTLGSDDGAPATPDAAADDAARRPWWRRPFG